MSDGQKVLTAWNKINLVRGFNDGILNTSQKFLLILITTHLGDNEYCFTSLTTLAHECMLTRANVNINLKKLISLGYVKKIPPSEGYKSNRYGIDFVRLSSIETIPLPKRVVSQQYQASIAAIPDQYRSDTTLVSERYPNRNIKEKEKKEKESLAGSDPEKPDQKLYTKKTFVFTYAEMQESYRRDIQIQPCFNAFVLNLSSKGREAFARSEWETWFARERNGRLAKATTPSVEDVVCSVCLRPGKGCYCHRPDERPAITGMNGVRHIGSVL